MERVKKARTPLRASITRTISEVENELASEEPDLDLLLEKKDKLQVLEQEVAESDQKMLDALLDADCTEEELEVEHVAIEQYRDKIRKWKRAIDKLSARQQRPQSPSSSVDGSSVSGVEKKRTYKLPKIEIKKFHGNLTEWLSFWSQFLKIHEDDELHDSDKFQYLVQSMVQGTRARELVDSYPQTADNYPKVVEALKERFGNEDLLKQVYVRELLKMVLSNAKSKEGIPLSKMYDKLEAHLRALTSLGVTLEQSATFLYPMVESSLPEDVLIAWQRSSLYGKDESKGDPPKSELDLMMQFIKQEVRAEELRTLARGGFGSNSKDQRSEVQKTVKPVKNRTQPSESNIPTAAGLFTGKGQSCIFCENFHETKECGKSDSFTIEEKRSKLQAKGVCFTCFKPGHSARQCRSYVKCLVCQKKHFTIMCPDINKKGEQKNQGTPRKEESSDSSVVSTAMNCTSEVLLQTLLVRLNGKGTHHLARLIFDNGSQRSYVKRSTIELLKIKAIGQELIRKALFGGSITEVKQHKKYRLNLESLDGSTSREIEVLDEPIVCGKIPRTPKGPWMKELKNRNISISDMSSNRDADIEILVGSDYWGSFITGNVIQLQNGLTAMETVLGWTICGKMSEKNEDNLATLIVSTMFAANSSIAELWSLETLGIKDEAESKSKEQKELAAIEQFKETVTRREDGRYSVTLPWIDGTPEISNNKKIAEARLRSTTTKLRAINEFDNYDQVFKMWQMEGIIEEVPETDKNKISHYLPHRPVFKPESLTTPVRPVFDASCKVGRAPSLNECLEKGPNQMEQIPSILLRFREKKIGVIADIRKAFQMIEVKACDRDFLRFLWWEAGNQNPKEFRHTRVVFGVNCSPFLLAAVIEQHLTSVCGDCKLTAHRLLESLYVDNCVTSVDSYEEYVTFKTEATRLMADAKMELCRWENTSEERFTNKELGTPLEETTSVLGLQWNKQTDELNCLLTTTDIPSKITKRFMLSQIQRIFDPMGFLCPALLRPKLMIQKSWTVNRDWDSELEKEIEQDFRQWVDESSVLAEIKLPRYIGGGSSLRENYQVHTFCDASGDAYATAIFLRIEKEESVSVQLLQAKTRVKPLKQVTMPRLELLACFIAARLTTTVKKSLNLQENPTYFWSDSTTALAWIKRNDEWGTFVGNRVKTICSLSNSDDWRHVPGDINPADLPSRGCSPTQLKATRWWEGPEWLKGPKEGWPSCDSSPDEDTVQKEKKKSTVLTMPVVEETKPWYYERFSSHLKNVRVLAWIRRFLDKSQRKSLQKGELTVNEVELAERTLFTLVQQEAFRSEKDKTVIAGLRVERENGIIIVKTKLLHRQDSSAFIKPILLPNQHTVVERLIREEHTKNQHAGVQFLMGKLREKCWILQGRKAIKKIIRSCVKCKRYTARSPEVPEAPLPEDRVKTTKVFEVTGVDLAGPLYLKNQGKAWIVLFTCAVYHGVHLELVQSLSTEAFLLALHRFISRRGRPSIIYSDNGTNFVGADNLFKQLNWKRIERETLLHRIQWKFNPPSAAWWGGWWERLIRSMKDLLKRVLGHQKLNYVQMETCLCEVEAVINSRPLTYITEDPDDLVALTPAMFLRDLRESQFPEAEVLDGDGLRVANQNLKQMREELRVRFRKEYLAHLVHRGKGKKTREFQVGEVVLVGVDNRRRLDWPMAKILELIPGKDGKVRVARVKTSTGTFVRPLQRLFHLEITSGEELTSQNEDMKLTKKSVVVQEPEDPRPALRTRSGRLVKAPERWK